MFLDTTGKTTLVSGLVSTPFAILPDFVRKVVEILEQEIQEFNNILYITS